MSNAADGSKVALPRGKVYFARKSTAGVLGPYDFIGNCSQLDFSTLGEDIAQITDFTSNSPTPIVRITKTRAPEFALKLYECDPSNLALLFMASPPNEYTQAATAVTGETMAGGAHVTGIYQTAKLGPITGVAVKKGATVFTVGTNYFVRDANLGIIEITSLPGGVAEGDAITVDYTPTAYVAGSGFQQVGAGTVSRIEGRLLYTGTSTVGPRHNLNIWNCAVNADGTYPFIASDPVEFGLKVSVLTDPNHTELWLLTETDNGSGLPLP